MPVYMDRHFVEGATRSAVAGAHEADLAIQEKYKTQVLTYWFDEPRCTGPVGSNVKLLPCENAR